MPVIRIYKDDLVYSVMMNGAVRKGLDGYDFPENKLRENVERIVDNIRTILESPIVVEAEGYGRVDVL